MIFLYDKQKYYIKLYYICLLLFNIEKKQMYFYITILVKLNFIILQNLGIYKIININHNAS